MFGIIEEKNNDENINVNNKKTISPFHSVHYYVNLSPEVVAEKVCGKEWKYCDQLEDVSFEGFTKGGYVVIRNGPKSVEVISKGSGITQNYYKNRVGDADVSITVSASDTKSWSVGLSIGPKYKLGSSNFTEIAAAASGGWSQSKTTGISNTWRFNCMYEKNWMEFVVNTTKVETANFKGFAIFNIRMGYYDFNDMWQRKNVKATIHMDGKNGIQGRFSGIKPTSGTEFVYRHSGRALRH